MIYLTAEHLGEHFSVLSLRTKCSSFPRCRNSDRAAGCTRGKHTILRSQRQGRRSQATWSVHCSRRLRRPPAKGGLQSTVHVPTHSLTPSAHGKKHISRFQIFHKVLLLCVFSFVCFSLVFVGFNCQLFCENYFLSLRSLCVSDGSVADARGLVDIISPNTWSSIKQCLQEKNLGECVFYGTILFFFCMRVSH